MCNMKVKLSQIKVKPGSGQEYSNTEIEELVKSMQKNGLQEPILVTPGKVLISGHKRYMAATSLGWKEIEVNVRNVSSENDEFTITPAHHNQSKKSTDALNEIQQLYQNYKIPHSNHPASSNEDKNSLENNRQMENWYW